MSKQTVFVTFSICATAITIAAMFANAGPLTPPAGPVAPTPGPEPRTPIGPDTTPGDANTVFRITQPGSYYLTADVIGEPGKHGVEIDTTNVTVDLNGFSLIGVAGSGAGIDASVSGLAEVVEIRNGTVRDWGNHGVFARSRVRNLALRGVRSVENGGDGFRATTSIYTELLACVATDNAGYGVQGSSGALVDRCLVAGNDLGGIKGSTAWTVTNSTVTNQSVGNGNIGVDIQAGVIKHCTISFCDIGANIDAGVDIRGCTIANCSEIGIRAGGNCTVAENTVSNCGGAIQLGGGIQTTGDKNRVDGNHVVGASSEVNTTAGIRLLGRDDFLVRNTVSGHDTPYGVSIFSKFSAIINNPPIPFVADPWANFSY